VTREFAEILWPQIEQSINFAIKSFGTEKITQIDQNPIQSQSATQSYSSYTALLSTWKQQVVSGVGNLSTRSLSPSFEVSAGQDIFANPDCVAFALPGTVLSNLNPCLVTGGSKSAVFIGNSHARMLQSTVSKSLKSRGYKTYSLSIGSCGIANVTPVTNSIPTKDCDVFRAAVKSLVSKVRPEVLVIAQSDGPQSKNFLPPGISTLKGLSRDSTLYWSEFEKALVQLKQSTKNVIVIGETPNLPKDVIDCVDSNGKLAAECVGDPLELNQTVLGERNAVASITENYLDIREWLCTNKTCPAIIRNTLVYTDRSHLTYAIQAQLIPLFTAYVGSLGL
jgi:hypothetical protein